MSPASSGGARVAFFGGSFDPPHIGHIAVAAAARQALDLDRILFAPVGLQPLKPAGSSASFKDRVAMTRLAIASQEGFELSLADAPKSAGDAPNFTVYTLATVRASLPPEATLYLLLGADSFLALHQWHRAAEIPFLAGLIVASRPNENLGDLSACLPPGVALEPLTGPPDRYRLTNAAGQQSSLTILTDLHYDISATQLRSQVHDPTGHDSTSHDPTSHDPRLLDPAVLAYIREHHLYAE